MTRLVQSSCVEEVDAPSIQSFEVEKEETVRFIEGAVGRMARRDSVEAGLRELEAFLLHTLGLVKRDPGLEIAAYDLHAAAAVIVTSRSSQSTVVNVRPWRLLNDAARRFGERLKAAVPRYRRRRHRACDVATGVKTKSRQNFYANCLACVRLGAPIAIMSAGEC